MLVGACQLVGGLGHGCGAEGAGFEPVVPSMSVKVLVGRRNKAERAALLLAGNFCVLSQIIVGETDFTIPSQADAASVSRDKTAEYRHAHHAV